MNPLDAAEAELDYLLSLDEAQRIAALALLDACDPALAAKVRVWLQAMSASEGFMESTSRCARAQHQRVGAWRLLHAIGQGGMGEVWLAERADEVFEKQVAIKFLRSADADAMRRFDSERRLLARLEHPAIARLLDGGIDAVAGPYLVTEWIDGCALDVWAAQTRPSLDLCLNLFRQIAEAVAYAHSLLVVHRDIKPGNVLVDRAQRPRLLDFGIARLTEADGALAETRDQALTPRHAAPEQLSGGSVSTRTDVYALGDLLYRLLTGRGPLDLDAVALAELVRRICHEVPTAPSRVSRRSNWPLPDDLDAIVLKALDKAPEHRYASVDALLADLDAFRRGAPVAARSGGRVYRMRRFVGQHRLGVAVALLLSLSIATGVVATLWQAQAARREAARATAVKDFLLQVFASIDPERAKGRKVLAEELVRQGEERIATELSGTPELQYELLDMLSDMRLKLGQPEPRLQNLEQLCPIAESSFGRDSVEALDCRIELADAYRALSRFDDAAATLQPVLQAARDVLPPQPLMIAQAMAVEFLLAQDMGRNTEAERIVRAAIAIGREAEAGGGAQTASLLEHLAVFLGAQGRTDEAVPLLDEIVRFDVAQPHARSAADQINSRWNKLTNLWARHKFAQVVDGSNTLADFTAAKLGRNHPHYFRALQLRGIAQGRLGSYQDAVATLESALAIENMAEWSDGRHQQVLSADLALLLPALGRNADTLKLAEQTLQLTDGHQLAPSPAFISSYAAVFAALALGDDVAIQRWSDELERRFAALPENEQGGRRNSLLQARAAGLRVAGHAAAAMPVLDELVRGYQRADGGSTLNMERLRAERAFTLIDLGQFAAAALELRAVRDLLLLRFGDAHVAVAQIEVALAVLPGSFSLADERARRDSAEQRFRAATGRAADRLRLL